MGVLSDSNAAAGGWTDDRVATLKKLWLGGYSASQIAKQLRGVTRNAVIGKVTRLGLPGRSPVAASAASRINGRINGRIGGVAAAKPQPPRPAPKPAAPAPVKPFAVGGGRVQQPEALPLPPEPPPPAGLVLVPLDKLRPCQCRWPIGDPQGAGFGFCARRTPDPAEPYCPEPARLAHVPTPSGRVAQRRRDLGRQVLTIVARYG